MAGATATDNSEPVDVAIVSDQPTPYRLHVLRRLAAEIPEVRFHNLFTHNYRQLTEPWAVELEERLNPVHFPDLRLDYLHFVHRTSLRLYRAIRTSLAQRRVRLVILLGYNDLTRLLLIRDCQRRGLPLLLTGDSNVFGESGRSGLKLAVKRAYLRWVIRHVAGLMPMGTCGRAFFRLYADHDRPTFLFPYEPDYEALAKRRPEATRAFMAERNLNPGRRRLLYCGRLVPPKRVDLLIDAFARVAGRCPDWDLILAGDGPLRASLQARVPEPLRQRVRFLGFLQVDQTVACYHACDTLVLPSEFEPWALVINEAVGAGLAVIATEVVGAAVELVRHGANGLIVPPRDAAALADAILEVARPGRCDAMKAAAAGVLAQWRAAADPVEGVRQALRHFGLLPVPRLEAAGV